jgi:DNA-binding transcriptional regulator YhcF (GntR family)
VNREVSAGSLSAVPKYVQAAEIVRTQIADGALKPGTPVPSTASLARVTGFGRRTCRKAPPELIGTGILVPGATANCRARVAGPDRDRPVDGATRKLSAALAARRHAAGLTQPELAALIHYSVTAVGHAEQGRVWQAREFWEGADRALGADGELLRLYERKTGNAGI